MNTDDRALADLTRERSDAELLRLIARDCDRWPGEGGSAETLRQIADRLEASHAKPGDGGDFVAGPVWSDDECWTSEIQVVGGHYVVATVHGGSEAEVIARRDAVLAALQSPPPVVSGEARAREAMEALGYQRTFDAIAAATRSPLGSAAVSVSVKNFLDALQAPGTSTPPVVEEGRREAKQVVARIIREAVPAVQWLDGALPLAERIILALTPVEGVGDRSPELVEVIREWLMSTDHPVSDWECQFAEAIRSMMRASGWIEPNTLSTPVAAQGDEVRVHPDSIRGWANLMGEFGISLPIDLRNALATLGTPHGG